MIYPGIFVPFLLFISFAQSFSFPIEKRYNNDGIASIIAYSTQFQLNIASSVERGGLVQGLHDNNMVKFISSVEGTTNDFIVSTPLTFGEASVIFGWFNQYIVPAITTASSDMITNKPTFQQSNEISVLIQDIATLRNRFESMKTAMIPKLPANYVEQGKGMMNTIQTMLNTVVLVY